jgi:hypothetical protein
MEIIKTMKDVAELSFIPAGDWVRRLGEETASFDVVEVAASVPMCAGKRTMEWDYVITLSTRPDNRRVDLYVETRPQISPQKAFAVFERRAWMPPDGLLLVCAPYVSPRVAELCREQNVAYLDEVGNCRIVASGVFIHISGRPNRRASIETVGDPFSRKSSRIVRMLLSHPSRPWQVQQLAQEAGVSLGLASKVKTTLLREAYLEERDRLLYLRDPAKLLQAWAAQYRLHVKRVKLFAMSRPAETESRLADWCRAEKVAYALTQMSAAWRYSPMLRYDKSVIYVSAKIVMESSLMALLRHIDAKEVDTGANCTLWLTDDMAVLTDSKEFNGVKVVSPLQLYLDLKLLAGRGGEAAQEVLEDELAPLLLAPLIDGGKPGGHHE